MIKAEKLESPRKKVWRIAWPTITEQCLNLTVGLNEVFLLGHLAKEVSLKLGYDSATALSAASLGQFFGWIAFASFNGVGTAVTALVARSIGAKEHKKAESYAQQALLLSFGVGLLMAALMYVLAPALLSLLGAQGQLHDVATIFVQTTALGLPAFSVLVAGNATLRGIGNTRVPLVIMLVVNAVNIAVAWVFINGYFGMPILGARGAAMGAVASWTIGAGLVLACLFLNLKLWPAQRAFKVSFKLRLDFTMMNRIIGQAAPTVAEQWAFQIGIFIFARFLVSQGTLTYAAHNAVITIDSMSFLPAIGMGIANTVLVGQSLGAGRPEEARTYAITAYKMGLSFMAVMAVLFFIIPEFFLGLLIADPQVVATAVPALRIAAIFDPLICTVFILTGALRGAGDIRFPLYARMVSSIIVRVGVAFLLIEVAGLGLIGARLAMGADNALLAALVVWRFRSGKWKTIYKDRTAIPTPVEAHRKTNSNAAPLPEAAMPSADPG